MTTEKEMLVSEIIQEYGCCSFEELSDGLEAAEEKGCRNEYLATVFKDLGLCRWNLSPFVFVSSCCAFWQLGDGLKWFASGFDSRKVHLASFFSVFHTFSLS